MIRRASVIVLAVLLAAVLPAGALPSVQTAPGATGLQPGPQPGLLDALCPRVMPPDDDCYSIAIPGEVWATAAILPLREGDSPEETAAAIAAYDSLIPEPFFPIPERREIAVLMFRLDIAMSPDRDIDSDPGEGYAEGTIGIRVGFDAEDGYPYREGWWVLAQPLNDGSQYGAGRDIGLPKYMAESALRIDDDGRWRAHATDWADADQPDGPGSSEVPGGNTLIIEWTAEPAEVDDELADQLWSWGQYGDALFVNQRPYDEPGPHDPGMVKFTPFSVVPVHGLPATPFTTPPDPRLGTATVVLEGIAPGGMPFSEIVDPGPHTVPGTSAFTRGGSFITVDNLSNNGADEPSSDDEGVHRP